LRLCKWLIISAKQKQKKFFLDCQHIAEKIKKTTKKFFFNPHFFPNFVVGK